MYTVWQWLPVIKYLQLFLRKRIKSFNNQLDLCNKFRTYVYQACLNWNLSLKTEPKIADLFYIDVQNPSNNLVPFCCNTYQQLKAICLQ